MRARTWCASRDVASTCASPRCTGGSGAGTAGQDEGKVGVGALCAAGLTFVKWGEGTTDEAPWEQHQPRGSPTSWQAEVPGFPPGPRPATAQRGDTESAGRGGAPPGTAAHGPALPVLPCRCQPGVAAARNWHPKAPARETPGREGRRPRRQGGWQLGERGGGARGTWWEGRWARHVSDAVCA